MRRLLGLGAAVVLAGSIGTADAAPITFEDIGVAPGTEAFHDAGNDPISGGFRFDAATHSHIANRSWGTDNGSSHLVADDLFGPDPITVSPLSGQPFALTALDISEAHPDAFFAARQVEITGHLFGGGTISTTLFLDNNLVSGVYANYFQTFTFDAAWGNLSAFTLAGGGAQAGNYFAIDNVVAQSVPEPVTLSLLGLGTALLFGRHRRARREILR
jgi:hypothetical protein